MDNPMYLSSKCGSDLEYFYKLNRHKGWRAKDAITNARTMIDWRELEDECVRLLIKPDDTCSFDDLKGDVFNPSVNTGIQPSKLKREEMEFEERVRLDGVVGIVGEYRCPYCGEWLQVDSVWGFVGDDWRDSGYDTDIMATTLDAYHEIADMFSPDIFPFTCRC